MRELQFLFAAEAFVRHWCSARGIEQDWLSQTVTRTVSDPNQHFWVECVLADARRHHSADKKADIIYTYPKNIGEFAKIIISDIFCVLFFLFIN